MAAFTLSRGSTDLPIDFAEAAGADKAICAGSSTRSASPAAAQGLRRAILCFDRDADTAEKIGRQHAASAHDHRVVADLEHLACVLDRHLLPIDLFDV